MGATTLISVLSLASVLMLPGDEPPWKQKEIPQWDDQDARTILAESPWVGSVKLEKVRTLSKFERRDSGNWEAGTPDTLGPFTPDGLLKLATMFDPQTSALAQELAQRLQPDLGSVRVRWESAMPVRAAELKAGEADTPNWDGDYYAIAVYDVVPPFRWNLADELKGIAYLGREKRKDLKPARVQIVPRPKGLITIVYLFPRSAEITQKDGPVRFVAQIGRLFISQFFFPQEMQFMGMPEL
jgi:hypothetical protein